MDPTIIAVGFAVGILLGLTGMGGGSLLTPLLILVFGIDPSTAVGTDIAYQALTKTVGGARHLRQRTVDLPLAAWMACGSVPAALAGTFLFTVLRQSAGSSFQTVLIATIGGALLLTGTGMLARLLLLRAPRERESVELTRATRAAALGVGAIIGLILGVTSAGSGTLIGVAMIVVFRLAPRRAVGSNVVHAAILLWAAGLAHLVVGDIDFVLAGTLLLGSVPGVWIGSRWAMRVPAGALRIALGVVVFGAGLGMVAKAGADIPAPVLAAVPALVAALVGGSILISRRGARRVARTSS